MYINFKAINNVLDAKMILKTHLLIKIFRLLFKKTFLKKNVKLKTAMSCLECHKAICKHVQI